LTSLLGLFHTVIDFVLKGKSMKLTTKGRYAVTAVLDLALHSDCGPVALAEIAERQNLSVSYLEQLFSKLRRGSIVKAVKGPGGGYLLNRPTDQINMSELIDAVEERVDATKCGGGTDCQRGLICLTHTLWQDLNTQVHGFLKSVTIASLMTEKTVLDVASRQDNRVRQGL